jgi:hypothetical protein
MKGRPHYPHQVSGKEKRQGRSKPPSGIAPSWPDKGRQNATGTYRRAPKPLHPDCKTDKHPHRALTRAWLRDGLTIEQATLYVQDNDSGALGQRALHVYAGMLAQLEK